MFEFNLGDEVKDQITGYKGFIVARCDYMTGCNRYGIGQKMKKDGTLPKWQWFDEPSLKLTKKNVIDILPKGKKIKTGGPRSANQTPDK